MAVIIALAHPGGDSDLFADRPETRGDRHARRAGIVAVLRARADHSQAALRTYLAQAGATEVRPLWVVNAVAARVSPALVEALRRFPGVRSIAPDRQIRAPGTELGSGSPPQWNIGAVQAPAVWDLGFDGTGAVVANMDTGVDLEHADVKSRWRGGTDSWWDPYRSTATPYDPIGHGTQTMGLMVGGEADGTAIGVAPGAQWIATKIYDDSGNTSVSIIHLAFQWLLTPSGVPGAPDAPDVVNASWGLESVNSCDDTFHDDFEALRAAGILVVFAAGNSGPAPSTSISPANNVDGYSVGAVDQGEAIDPSSSRGPGACTGGIYPDLVAPGVNVKTADRSLAGIPQYAYVSGTSAAAPHVAGVAALLAGAFPGAALATVEQTLRATARDLGPAGPDNAFGAGLVDASAAYAAIAAVTPLSVVTTALPDVTPGVPYAAKLRATGGAAPYAWSFGSGALPAGLALAASGAISGTATAQSTSTFTVQVRDTAGTTATRSLSLTALPVPPLRITTVNLPAGTVAASYSQLVTATGGVPPYAWSVAAAACPGGLPPGLSLDPATGTLSGTPTASGSFSFTAQVTDQPRSLASRLFLLTIQP
jgi:subtilisin family serine protease